MLTMAPTDPHNCRVALRAARDSASISDEMTNYDVWQAAVALKSMCERQGKFGKITNLGNSSLQES